MTQPLLAQRRRAVDVGLVGQAKDPALCAFDVLFRRPRGARAAVSRIHRPAVFNVFAWASAAETQRGVR